MKSSASHLQGKPSVTVFTVIFLRIQVYWNVTFVPELGVRRCFEESWTLENKGITFLRILEKTSTATQF